MELLFNIVSWEPEGRYQHSKMFRWEAEGHYDRSTMSMAIAPFWFSLEYIWVVIVPFWLSTDDIIQDYFIKVCMNTFTAIHGTIILKTHIRHKWVCVTETLSSTPIPDSILLHDIAERRWLSRFNGQSYNLKI